MPIRIAALLACHNRREKTVTCLRALRAQILPVREFCESQTTEDSCQKSEVRSQKSEVPSDQQLSTSEPSLSAFSFQPSAYSINVFLVDDGSTDGTADAVREVWPEATIIQGNGNLFWCAGMREAWAEAAKTDPDFYLLLNDDTVLYPEAVASLLEVAPNPSSTLIAAGAIRDPESLAWAYGGLQSDHPFPMPDGTPRPCRTMNANCSLVPRKVFREIGMFHPAYRHAMGDMDYGLSATRQGIPILETPIFIGECRRNSSKGTWRDVELSRIDRWRKLMSPKGLPLRDWFAYCTRNCGWKWLRYFVSPYLRILFGK